MFRQNFVKVSSVTNEQTTNECKTVSTSKKSELINSQADRYKILLVISVLTGLE